MVQEAWGCHCPSAVGVAWATACPEDGRAVLCLPLRSPASGSGPDVERVLQTPSGLSAYRTNKETGRLVLDSGIRGSGH